MNTSNSIKRNALNKRLEALAKQYEAAYAQLNVTQSAVDAIKIEGMIAELDQKMNEVSAELTVLEQSASVPSPTPHHRSWEATLPDLDFRQAWRHFSTIFEDHLEGEDGGTALFLLPNFDQMRGDLLLRRIYAYLEQKVGYTRIKHVQIELLDHNQLTNLQLLQRLGNAFGCPLPVTPTTTMLDLAAYADQIITKMCNALEREGILFIELTIVPAEFYVEESFLRWFLDHFWSRLALRLSAAIRETQRPSLKCLITIAAHKPLPPAYPLAERYCQAEHFTRAHCQHIVPLPLTRWSQEEIRIWLRRQPLISERWDEQTLHEKAYSLFARGDNGTPISVLYYLREMFATLPVNS